MAVQAKKILWFIGCGVLGTIVFYSLPASSQSQSDLSPNASHSNREVPVNLAGEEDESLTHLQPEPAENSDNAGTTAIKDPHWKDPVEIYPDESDPVDQNLGKGDPVTTQKDTSDPVQAWQ